MRKSLVFGLFVGLMACAVLAFPARAQGAQPITLQLSSSDEQVWSDSQWAFYKAPVPISNQLIFNFTYSGTLDIDARLYYGRRPDGMEPWDITHEGLEVYAPDGNSQSRGVTGFEELRYYNELYQDGRWVYILIFSYSGTGDSTIQIQTSIDLTRVQPRLGGLLGWVIDNIVLVIAVLGGALAGLIAVMNHFRKKYRKYIEAQKEATAKEKLGKSVAQ